MLWKCYVVVMGGIIVVIMNKRHEGRPLCSNESPAANDFGS